MATNTVKCIISFSSQDAKFPAENLASGKGVLKWLGSPNDRSGRLEVTVQLQEPCVLGFVDISTIWAFSVQILVGRSTWSADQHYKPLLLGTNLMTPKDCRQDKNTQKVKMFKYEDFTTEVRDECWDRIRIVLSQPFRKDRQMGLQFLRITEKREHGDDKISELNSATPSKTLGKLLGKTQTTNRGDSVLKSRLIKMEGSSEHGAEREEGMSRQARMVMAAVANTPKYKGFQTPSPKSSPRAAVPSRPVKRDLSFDEEVDKFLSALDKQTLDLEKVTFADLRHMLEKRKCRKLSKEEKVLFKEKAVVFVGKMVAQLTCEGSAAETGEPRSELTRGSTDAAKSPSIHKQSSSHQRRKAAPPSSPSLRLHLEETSNDNFSQRESKGNSPVVNSSCTQDLHLRLRSQVSQQNSVERVQNVSRVCADLDTEELSLHLESEKCTHSVEMEGQLKLRLESSAENKTAEGCRTLQRTPQSKTDSTLKAQKSLITSVQRAFAHLENEALSAEGNYETRRPVRKGNLKPDDMKYLAKAGTITQVDDQNDNVWLSASKDTKQNETKSQKSGTPAGGNKRKRSLPQSDGAAPTKRKTKDKRQGKCSHCHETFPVKKLKVHEPVCGELSTDAELNSQVQLIMEERRSKLITKRVSSKSHEVPNSTKCLEDFGSKQTGSHGKPPSEGAGGAECDRENSVDCPLCGSTFPQCLIEQHAEVCDGDSNQSVNCECPVCTRKFHPHELQAHVYRCLESTCK